MSQNNTEIKIELIKNEIIKANTVLMEKIISDYDENIDDFEMEWKDDALDAINKNFPNTETTDSEYNFQGEQKMNNTIEMELPNGLILIAEQRDDPHFPGIRISVKDEKNDNITETVCFIEYNSCRAAGKELCIGVYMQDQDEPAYYDCYHALDDGQE